MKARVSESLRPLIVSLLLVGLLIALLSSLACGQEATPSSGIVGEVWVGPISPVARPGEPDAKPYSAVLRIRSIPDDKVVAEVTSDANGRFRVALDPGRYLLEPEQGDPLPIAPTQEVMVVMGEFAHVRIDYDSGIR